MEVAKVGRQEEHAWLVNLQRYCTSVKSKATAEYIDRAREADRRLGVQEGRICRVEAKLVSIGKLLGIVAGNFGEVSSHTDELIAVLATSKVKKAGLGRCQASSLLRILETLGMKVLLQWGGSGRLLS